MKTEAVINKTTTTLAKFGSATVGAIAGGVVASRIPALDFLNKIPGVGDMLSKVAPGLIVMLLAHLAASNFKSEEVENGSIGMGLAGFVDVLRRTGLLEKINAAIPGSGLSGLRGSVGPLRGGNMGLVVNTGAYSPEYFMKSNWASRPLNGLRGEDTQSFSLQGADKQAFGLQGAEQKAFGLQGRMGCMFQ